MGYKIVPLRRGFTQVKTFFDLCNEWDSVICGGYARYCASPLSPQSVIPASDVDLFPNSVGSAVGLTKALRRLGYTIKFENEVSITMHPRKKKLEELKWMPIPQIIKPVVAGRVMTVGTTEEILNNFDFTVVRAAIISPTEVLVDEDFENDESKKLLRIKNIHCPISSTLRCCKYSRKGYFLKPVEALKLFTDWMNREEGYRQRIIELFQKSAFSKKGENEMTRQEIDELEALLRVD